MNGLLGKSLELRDAGPRSGSGTVLPANIDLEDVRMIARLDAALKQRIRTTDADASHCSPSAGSVYHILAVPPPMTRKEDLLSLFL